MFDPQGIDVVIPLGVGSKFRDMELRYCLRSLERYGRGVRRVVIVGQKPKWLSAAATHVACPWIDAPKDARIALKTLWTFENSDVSDEILFANDDYFFLGDFDARTVAPYQRGNLLDFALPKEGEQSAYEKILEATYEALSLGKLPTYHYDIHVPIRYRRDVFVSLKPWWEKSRKSTNGLVVKSIYGNFTNDTLPGPHLADFKLASFSNEPDFETLLAKFPDRWVISYADQPLYQGFETVLFNRFPAKSRFEL